MRHNIVPSGSCDLPIVSFLTACTCQITRSEYGFCLPCNAGMFGAVFMVWKRLVDTFWFYRLGVPEAAEHFIRLYGDIATVDIMFVGRLTFTSRYFMN